MMDWRILGVLAVLLISACDSSHKDSSHKDSGHKDSGHKDSAIEDSAPKPEPLVVYASAASEAKVTALLAEFTDDSGVPTTLKIEDSSVNTNRVINDEGSPPADVLITTNVADIWRAADEGALRPIQSESLASSDARFRDPNGYWVAISYDTAVIVYSDTVDQQPEHYADLASPEAKGKVCLSSPSLAVNRTLIAMLIDELGRRPAELMVRAWVFNRATLPFASDEELLAAIDSGACQYGIVASTAAAGRERVVEPELAYYDVHAAGIVRHARYPESAQRFLDWMLNEYPLRDAAGLSAKNIGVAGWLAEEAQLLAERASYR